MKTSKQYAFMMTIAMMAVGLLWTPMSANAQDVLRNQNRLSYSQIGQIIQRVEGSSDRFRRAFDQQMDRNRRANDQGYVTIVNEYEVAVDELRRDYGRTRNWWEIRNSVSNVIREAQDVNTMMNSLSFRRNLETQWNTNRTDLNALADTFDLPGLNGGGWQGGNNGNWNNGNNGNWNNGRMGRPIAPPSWAVGTFYGMDNQNRRIVLTISPDGTVTASADGSPFYGNFTRGNVLRTGDDRSVVTRSGNGIATTRTDNGERTVFSRNDRTGGGNWNNGSDVDRINPPSWAIGTFYGRDPQGRQITLTISNNGRVSANADGTPFDGTFGRGNTLHMGDGDVSRVTQTRNGLMTTRNSNGERTTFRRQ